MREHFVPYRSRQNKGPEIRAASHRCRRIFPCPTFTLPPGRDHQADNFNIILDGPDTRSICVTTRKPRVDSRDIDRCCLQMHEDVLRTECSRAIRYELTIVGSTWRTYIKLN